MSPLRNLMPAVRSFGKLRVAATSALAALRDPTRADSVAELGEATGDRALRSIVHQMMSDPVGSRLLREKPRLNSRTLAADSLRELPQYSLGRSYLAYCERYGFSADERPPVTLVADPELAYAMTRYREVHDFLHILTGLPPTVEGELALKTLEAVQTGLPMTVMSALAGPLSLHEPTRWEHAHPPSATPLPANHAEGSQRHTAGDCV